MTTPQTPPAPSTPRTDELLPCPLCGGRAQFAVRRHGSYMDKTYDIFCTECFFGSNSGFLDKDKIFEFWNTRPAQAALSEEEAVLHDEIAMRAMQAMISKSSGQDSIGGKKGVPLVAKYAYEYADKMIAQRRALTSQNRGGR